MLGSTASIMRIISGTSLYILPCSKSSVQCCCEAFYQVAVFYQCHMQIRSPCFFNVQFPYICLFPCFAAYWAQCISYQPNEPERRHCNFRGVCHSPPFNLFLKLLRLFPQIIPNLVKIKPIIIPFRPEKPDNFHSRAIMEMDWLEPCRGLDCHRLNNWNLPIKFKRKRRKRV